MPHLRLLALALALLAAAPAHAADRRMSSYDAASPDARRLTGAGLTFVFEKSLFRTRVFAIRATAVPVGVVVEPLRDGAVARKLDALMGEEGRDETLYMIDPAEEQGKVMVQAFCPGATRGWLAIGPLGDYRPLKVHAFGDDPVSGEPMLCAAMDFTFRGEWRPPRTNKADPTDQIFRPVWEQ